MMRILVSNDDGVLAPGLKILAKKLESLGEVWVVAPLEEKSATGHSLTLHKPLRMIEMGKRIFGVSGSPADCVSLGIRQALGRKPDIVVSGINRGANLGQDVYYSGTVSAAREACIMGIRSIAVSTVVNFQKPPKETQIHYSAAAAMTVRVIKKLKDVEFPPFSLLNLNVPDQPLSTIKGPCLTRQGLRYYSGTVLRRKDHRGRDYYWIGGQYKGFRIERDTDCYSVDHDYASVTPLQIDTTNYHFMDHLDHLWPRGEHELGRHLRPRNQKSRRKKKK